MLRSERGDGSMQRLGVRFVARMVAKHGCHLRRRHCRVVRCIDVRHSSPSQAAIIRVELRRHQHGRRCAVFASHRHDDSLLR